MPTQQFTSSWSRGSDSLSGYASITDDGAIDVDTTVPASTTNKEVDVALDVSKLSGIFIKSDVTITVKTNSTSAPDDALTITAGIPLSWFTGCGMTCPLTVDVTKLYLTNATTGAATVALRFLQDVTA